MRGENDVWSRHWIWRCDIKSDFDSYVVFFFFQAEDGIRDYKVTGVQTCALPISAGGAPLRGSAEGASGVGHQRPPRSRAARPGRLSITRLTAIVRLAIASDGADRKSVV